MNRSWVTVMGIVQSGHQVASGRAENNPYPDGTIHLQKPFFKKLGIDLTEFYDATLNVSISPYVFSMQKPELTLRQVEWTPLHPPEDFSFSACRVKFNHVEYNGWIYYPHPETKKTHFQEPSILEIIAPLIPGLQYGDEIQVSIDKNEVSLKQKSD